MTRIMTKTVDGLVDPAAYYVTPDLKSPLVSDQETLEKEISLYENQFANLTPAELERIIQDSVFPTAAKIAANRNLTRGNVLKFVKGANPASEL